MKDSSPLIFERNPPGVTERLARATIAIAGCGGLGSNAAVSLVRSGVRHLILVDKDRVEASNLNRQHFFLRDLGRPKVEALAEHLRAINPDVMLELHHLELTAPGVAQHFGAAELLIEAFDHAGQKRWLIEAWARAFPERPVLCGNGLSGFGRAEALTVRRAGQIYFCGDGESEATQGLCAPRVALVANLQANLAVELLMVPSGS